MALFLLKRIFRNFFFGRLSALLASFAVEVTKVMTELEPLCRENKQRRVGEGNSMREQDERAKILIVDDEKVKPIAGVLTGF